MSEKERWIESKSKERSSENFIRTILGYADYKVMNYSIENHNKEIIKQIAGNYIVFSLLSF